MPALYLCLPRHGGGGAARSNGAGSFKRLFAMLTLATVAGTLAGVLR